MLDKADKKAIMLCILKTLEIHTDAEHPLTHEQIAQRLEKDFGLDKPSRNTIANHINILRDGLDYDIRYGAGNKGVYLVDRILLYFVNMKSHKKASKIPFFSTGFSLYQARLYCLAGSYATC